MTNPKTTVVDHVVLLDPGIGTSRGRIVIEGGRIVAAGADAVAPAGAEIIDGKGGLLTPGLIDVHVHGIGRYNFDNGPEDLLNAAPGFAHYGTTTVLPTLVPRQGKQLLARLAAIAGVLDQVTGVHVPGFHLEGPFVAIPGAGCDVLPGDRVLLEEILAACKGKVKVMSVSPDTPGIIPVIERLREAGVVPFVTHTRADVVQTEAALAAGARHATHFYDVFPVPAERDPGVRPAGVVEAFLAGDDTTVDFIADGCHVDPVVIRMAIKALGIRRVSLITDGNIGAGLPPGEYPTPWGYPVCVAAGRGARVADPSSRLHGCLAGSALTMNAGMANLLGWLRLPPEQVWMMGTANPAAVVELTDVGTLTPGVRADVVLWNKDLTPAHVWVAGIPTMPAKTQGC